MFAPKFAIGFWHEAILPPASDIFSMSLAQHPRYVSFSSDPSVRSGTCWERSDLNRPTNQRVLKPVDEAMMLMPTQDQHHQP